MYVRKQELRVSPLGKPLRFSVVKGASFPLEQRTLYNMSRSGLFVSADRLPSPGDVFEFSLSTETCEIRGEGQVRWCQDGHTPIRPRGFGLAIQRFHGHDQKLYLKVLNQYLEDLRVQDLLLPQPMVFSTESPLFDVVEWFRQPGRDCALVTSGGKSAGVYEPCHVIDLLAKGSDLSRPLRDYLNPHFDTFEGMSSVDAAMQVLSRSKQNYFPVVQNGGLLGMVSRHSMSRAWTELLELKIRCLEVTQEQYHQGVHKEVVGNVDFVRSVLAMLGHRNGLELQGFVQTHLRELLESFCYQASSSVQVLSAGATASEKPLVEPVLLAQLIQDICQRFSGWLENQGRALEWDLFEITQVPIGRTVEHVRQVICGLVMQSLQKGGTGQDLFLSAQKSKDAVRVKIVYESQDIDRGGAISLDYDRWEDIHVLSEGDKDGLYVDLPMGPSGIMFHH